MGKLEPDIREVSGPLRPSVENESHYWIAGGQIIWAGKRTSEQIAAGQRQ